MGPDEGSLSVEEEKKNHFNSWAGFEQKQNIVESKSAGNKLGLLILSNSNTNIYI